MKSSVVLILALLLVSGVVWAEEATPQDSAALTATAVSAEPGAEPAVEADGGGCMLPDLDGLSDGEARSTLEKAGFDLTSAVSTATPVCPTRFSCSSIFNCGIGSLCAVADIGPCCTRSGLTLCCIQGSIKVRTCPCKCTGNPCNIQCPSSTDVQWRCS
jgi:hypothetical protein